MKVFTLSMLRKGRQDNARLNMDLEDRLVFDRLATQLICCIMVPVLVVLLFFGFIVYKDTHWDIAKKRVVVNEKPYIPPKQAEFMDDGSWTESHVAGAPEIRYIQETVRKEDL